MNYLSRESLRIINKVHCLVLTKKASVCYFSLVIQITGKVGSHDQTKMCLERVQNLYF